MFQRKHAKSPSFWPLPGGIENFVQTLNKALSYIRDSRPTIDELTQWLVNTFPKVTKEKNAKGYINSMLRHSGLVKFDKTGFTLSERGKDYLEHPSNKILFQIFNENVLGFGEIIMLLGTKSRNIDELHKALVKELTPYHVKWTSRAQPYFRLSWLRSMGFVTVRGHQYCLTDEGRELLNELGSVIIPGKLVVERPIVEEKRLAKPKTLFESMAETISTKLKNAEHASDEPERYEEAIKEAFEFLGFKAEHRGEPGETDVIALANLGDETYSIILDGKTTRGERINDRHISWPTIDEHRVKHNADYAVIVGPSFAGGDLLERSKTYKILLLQTETLLELLKIHSGTPFTLIDLKDTFGKVGLLRLEECSELIRRKKEYERQLDLISKVLFKLQHLQSLSEPTTVNDLRWALEKKFSVDEISRALSLLQKLGMIRKNETGEFIALVTPRVAVAKLKAFADAIESS